MAVFNPAVFGYPTFNSASPTGTGPAPLIVGGSSRPSPGTAAAMVPLASVTAARPAMGSASADRPPTGTAPAQRPR